MNIPRGLLSFGRKIKRQDKDVRHHKYIWWLSRYNPEWLDNYCRKYNKNRGRK